MTDDMRMFWVPMAPTTATLEEIETTRHQPNVFDIPVDMVYRLSCEKILTRDYGYTESLRRKEAVDGDGEPIPLFTYPAIEYLRQFDLSDRDLFEYGAGNSTRFFGPLVRSVTAVDNNREWVDKLRPDLAANISIHFAESDRLAGAIHGFDRSFDIIVVDAMENRYDCAREAIGRLNEGGMIILDNAESYHRTAALLRDADLIEVDMTGFKPTYYHTSTTSFFLHRKFDFRPRAGRQPHFGVGSRHYHSAEWDKPGSADG